MSDNPINDTAIKCIHIHADGTDHIEIMFNSEDEFYQAIVEFIRVKYRISSGMIQREFSIGYNLTSRIMERMAQEKIIKFLGAEKGWRVLV